jgi:hypothetical protein
MADWVSSLLAGLGAGAESLGTSMTEREKRTAAAKQRNMELSNEMAMKMAEYGLSPDVNLPTSAAVQGIGNLRMTTPDPITSFAKNLSIGQDTGKTLAPSPRFDVFKGLEAATGDMSDAATNADMSGAGVRGLVSAYGAPTMPRTKLGMEAGVPDVQAQLGAPPMTTGAGDENLPRMSLIDPTTGQSTRYKRDITQSLPYLQMQATTKANEERDAARQEAQGVREAAAQAVKNADTLREQARAKQEKNRSDYEYIRIVDGKNLIVQKAYNDLTSDQQNSLGQIADTVKERDKIKTTADNRTPAARFAQFIDGEGKLHYVTQEIGAANGWILAPTNTAGGTRGTAVLEKERAKNDALLMNVQQAITALTTPGAAGAGAVGAKAYVPAPLLDRADTAGVSTRTKVQKIGAREIHDIFGSALTKTEKGRAGFAPDPTYTPQANLARLNALKTELTNSTNEINKSIGNMRGGGGNAPTPVTTSQGDQILAKFHLTPSSKVP